MRTLADIPTVIIACIDDVDPFPVALPDVSCPHMP